MTSLNEFLGKAKNLFTGVEKIEGINAALTNAQAEVADLKDKLTQSESALVEANKTIEGLKADAKTKAEEHKKALEAKDKEVEGKASRQAGKIVEQAGVPPVKGEKEEAAEETAGDIKKKFASMKPGKERSEFYQKHKSILR